MPHRGGGIWLSLLGLRNGLNAASVACFSMEKQDSLRVHAMVVTRHISSVVAFRISKILIHAGVQATLLGMPYVMVCVHGLPPYIRYVMVFVYPHKHEQPQIPQTDPRRTPGEPYLIDFTTPPPPTRPQGPRGGFNPRILPPLTTGRTQRPLNPFVTVYVVVF